MIHTVVKDDSIQNIEFVLSAGVFIQLYSPATMNIMLYFLRRKLSNGDGNQRPEKK